MSYFPGKSCTRSKRFCSLKSKLYSFEVSSSMRVNFGFIFWKMTLAILVLPTLGRPIRHISIAIF